MAKKQKKITYASIVPLIGGESIGAMQALDGQMPEYVLSYTPFANNDKHYIAYLRSKGWKGDYVFLDEKTDYAPKHVNVVNAVCPCAGLSSLSTTSSADSKVNDWLYVSTRDVLERVKPDVFWGENAPRLYSKTGSSVVEKMFAIGREYGYSMTLYYTESRFHGLCQKRPRTFYFFTKGDKAPVFRYTRIPSENAEDVLSLNTPKDDPMDLLVNVNDPSQNAWIAYCIHATGSKDIKEFYTKIDASLNCVCAADNLYSDSMLDVAQWMDDNGFDPRFSRRARHMHAKCEENKGYWGHGETIAKGVIPSLIGAMPGCLVNAQKNRFLTIRDCMRLMKMPDDFNLATDKPLSEVNHICQNVPVTTAKHMMEFVIDYLNGNCELSNGTLVRQSNKTQQWENDTKIGSVERGNLTNFF